MDCMKEGQAEGGSEGWQQWREGESDIRHMAVYSAVME